VLVQNDVASVASVCEVIVASVQIVGTSASLEAWVDGNKLVRVSDVRTQHSSWYQ